MPRWLVWTLVAVLCWGIWAILTKLIGNALSATHSQALSTLGLLPVMVALGLSGRLTGGPRSIFAVAAGMLTCLGNAAYYEVLGRGAKAATVVPLTALYPLITVGLALLFLGERLNRFQIAGVLLSLPALYLLNVPDEQGIFSSALTWVLGPIALWGVSGLFQKLATNDISGELATLWFLVAFIPVAAVILVREPLPASIALRTWGLVTALGLFLALGNFAILAAFAHGGKASIIAPISSLYPLISIPIALTFLGEGIGHRETVGITLALASVVALSYEGRRAVPAPQVSQSNC
jgi:uncharacterized membrane protein